MTETLIGIAGFLGGAFLTAVGFVVSSSNSITAIKTDVATMKIDVAALKSDLRQIKEKPTVICSAHLDVAERLAKVEAKSEKSRS
jgi:hypothetical protein